MPYEAARQPTPHREIAGSVHLYQGRFRSFPVQSDDHLRTFCRHVERIALRAVRRGQPFGSESWRSDIAGRLGLASTLRPRGRPRKSPNIERRPDEA